MEKYKIFALIGVVLLLFAGYSYYTGEEITILPQDSYLNSINAATKINLQAGNFSAVQGLAQLTLSPDNYIVNATLVITTDDPQATIDVFSNTPFEIISTGSGNMTISLPTINNPVSFDIIFTFSNTTVQHQVTYSITMDYGSTPLTNSTTVYATP